MRRIVDRLFRLTGLRRTPPATRLGRSARQAERVGMVLLVLYGVLHVQPQVLFAHAIEVDGLTIHARRPLPPEAAACAARAASLVARSELASAGRAEHVFLCDAPWLFRLFHPTAGGFAYTVPWTGNIFVGQADFATDTARSPGATFNTRRLSAVLAHEVTHNLIRRRVGLVRGLTLPDWIAEGYCDHVAGEGSFPEARGRVLVARGERDPSVSFRYFEGRQMIDYLTEARHLSFDAIVARAGERDAVLAETRAWLKQRLGPGS